MAKIDQKELEAKIRDGDVHTIRSLSDFYKADWTMQMQIDRTLQKLRRKKLIAFEREGRQTLWQSISPTA